jgi:uncharacterized protein
MRAQAVGDGGQRLFVLVFESGDEVIGGLVDLARRERISGAQLSGIGAFREVTLAYFDAARGAYDEMTIGEQVEAVALSGNLGLLGDEPRAHVHVVVSRHDGATRGGHLVRAVVHPTLEVFATVLPVALRRAADPMTGLPLLRLPGVDESG